MWWSIPSWSSVWKKEKLMVECAHECLQAKDDQRLLSISCHGEQPGELESLAKKQNKKKSHDFLTCVKMSSVDLLSARGREATTCFPEVRPKGR